MRVFFILLIFAIGFSGYSAAAHAFAQGDCAPASISKAIDQGMDMSDCPGHDGSRDVKKDAEPSKNSKAKCLDCTHCCMTHVTLQQNDMIVFPPVAKIHNPSLEYGEPRDSLFSELRPPRSLV